MNAIRRILSLIIGASVASASSAADFSTPESAVRSLEAAYIAKDISAAVAARDFAEEARLMLHKINPELAKEAATLNQATHVLELSYRKEIRDKGFPQFANMQCSFSAPHEINASLVTLTETCALPNGRKSVEDVHVFKGANGWRVVTVINDP